MLMCFQTLCYIPCELACVAHGVSHLVHPKPETDPLWLSLDRIGFTPIQMRLTFGFKLHKIEN